jgi:hypothetical protein
VEASLRVSVSHCEAEIDHINLIVVVADTHENVGGFDVTVDEVARVDILDVHEIWVVGISGAPTLRLKQSWTLTNWSANSRTVDNVNLQW